MENMNDYEKYVASYSVLNTVTGETINGKKVLNSNAPIQAVKMLQSEVTSELGCGEGKATFWSISLVLEQR
jgi:hypothetical protein